MKNVCALFIYLNVKCFSAIHPKQMQINTKTVETNNIFK